MDVGGAPVVPGFFEAFLFDMDGTVINSIAAAERIWGRWALRHGLDVAAFLPTIHGARAVDTIARLGLPGVDAEAEAMGITLAEIDDVEGIVEIPGAARFVSALPAGRWAIVTSAPRALAIERLKAAGVPVPEVMVSADDVSAGKPDPACYILAAERLGVPVADCLVFEDAPVGIAAGEASGASVVVVTTTHHQPMDTPHPTIPGYAQLSAQSGADGLLSLSGVVGSAPRAD
jgi:sugar-phosphatase